MALKRKPKYYFDSSSLEIKKEKRNVKSVLVNIVGYLLVGLVFSTVAIILKDKYFLSSKEVKLKEELKLVRTHYNRLYDRVDMLEKVTEDIQQRDETLYRLIFEADYPQTKVKLNNNYSEFRDMQTADLVISTSEKIDDLSSALYAQSLSFDEIFEMVQTKKERLRCIPAIFPINKTDGRVSSGFGMRLHPLFRQLRMHTGMDISAPRGTPIYATGDGVVKTVKQSNEGSSYGIHVIVNHGFNYETLYAHMSKSNVRVGQRVKRGDVVGFVGSTGYSSGSHLHYEVRLKGKPANPVHYFFIDISPKEYLEILEKAREINQSLS